MEETITQAKIRVNFKQLANGEVRWEFTVRGDTPEEVERLIKETKDVISRQI